MPPAAGPVSPCTQVILTNAFRSAAARPGRRSGEHWSCRYAADGCHENAVGGTHERRRAIARRRRAYDRLPSTTPSPVAVVVPIVPTVPALVVTPQSDPGVVRQGAGRHDHPLDVTNLVEVHDLDSS